MAHYPALLLFTAMQLVAVASTNAQAITDRTAAAAPVLGERSHSASAPAACSPPKRGPTPPKTSPPPAPSPASVVQVCAPVFSVPQSSRLSQGTEAPMVPPEAETPRSPAAAASAPASAPAPAPAVESADSFKFKIKDLLEAEMKSSNPLLIGSLLLIFVVFAVLIVVAAKAVAARPKRSWIVALVGILLASALAFFVIQRITNRPIESTTIDKLYELKLAGASPEALHPQVLALAEQTQRQLAAMQAALREQHRNLASQLEAASLRPAAEGSDRMGLWSVAGLILATVLLMALGASAILVAMGKLEPLAKMPLAGKRRMSKSDASPDPVVSPPLPLNAIYQLEDLLSQLRMDADKTFRLLESDKPPAIADPEQFLRALNSVRRQLEGGLGIDERLTSETPVADAGYRFKTETGSSSFYYINKALDELDEALSSRYELPSDGWRPLVLPALAKARRSLIAVCEPKDMDTSAAAS